MTNHSHRGRLWTFLQTALMITLSLVAVAGHAEDASKSVSAGDRLPRVRTSDAVMASLIEEASAVSATFRGLVDVIDASDGLVYIFSRHCGRLAPACLTMSVTVAGPHTRRTLRAGCLAARPRASFAPKRPLSPDASSP